MFRKTINGDPFLQTLLTVIETGSAAETARRMNITPSAVNQRIKALERFTD